MKITETYLRQVIQEELDGVVRANDITSLQKNASGVTSEIALIAALRGALKQRKTEIKPNEYDTLWVAIETVLRVLETGNVDTVSANSNLKRGLELLLKSTVAGPGRVDRDADPLAGRTRALRTVAGPGRVDRDANPLAGRTRVNLKPVR